MMWILLGVYMAWIAPCAYGQAGPLVLRDGDRVVFVGDEITQQMFYTRATATALLGLYPEKGLRFFNGGRESASAGEAIEWVDQLMGLVRPTVVFVCFGFNEAQERVDPAEMLETYLQSLGGLLERIVQHPQVREVIVIGPPPMEAGLGKQLVRGELNHTLMVLSRVAGQVASSRGARYVNLFDHMSAVYRARAQIGGESLAIGGRLPNEQAHMVIASLLLRDIGVTSEQMTQVGWSPLLPVKMGRVRQVLAIPMSDPSADQARRSHELYMALGRFDELFFRVWRLPRRRTSKLGMDAQKAWQQVRLLAGQDTAASR